MKQRLNPSAVAPEGFAALLGVEKYLQGSGLDHRLQLLVKTRVSQINGCAYCLHMHTADARKAGKSEVRLHLLDAWREFEPLHRARARRARLGGVAHPHRRHARARRGVRRGAAAFLREGARRPVDRDRDDQRLEPADHRRAG